MHKPRSGILSRLILLLRIFFEQLQSEASHESRIISESFFDDLDKVNLQKWKLEDDLNDVYYERIRINQLKDEEDGN